MRVLFDYILSVNIWESSFWNTEVYNTVKLAIYCDEDINIIANGVTITMTAIIVLDWILGRCG